MAKYYDTTALLGGPGELQTATTKSRAEFVQWGDCPAVDDDTARVERVEEYDVHLEFPRVFAVPALGSVQGGFHVDRVEVSYKGGWPRVRIEAHRHGNEPHPALTPEFVFAPTVQFIAGYGFVPHGARSWTYTLEGRHVDAMSSSGTVDGAANCKVAEEIEVVALKAVDCLPGEGWLGTEIERGRGVNEVSTWTGTYRHEF